MMNLLFVIDDLGSGGAQRQMVYLAKGLVSRGHNIEFFTYYPNDHFRPILDKAKIPVSLCLKSSRFSLAPLRSIRRRIHEKKYDSILAFLDTPCLYSELARFGISSTKLIVSERFMYPPGKLSVGLRIYQEFHRFADAITVNSHHHRKRMLDEFPWMRHKIRTIYNGLDLEYFKPYGRVVKSPQLSLLAIASVSKKKNSLNLAKALLICKDKYGLSANIKWIGTHNVSGEGTLAWEKTNDFLEKYGLSNNWIWLKERSDIPNMLCTHDALVHPSYYEGLPNVICEALACGRPVLASNVCDHPLLINKGINGLLFDPDSPDSIADSIYKFSLLNNQERLDMGNAGRLFAKKHLSLDKFIVKYENLFKSLTNFG